MAGLSAARRGAGQGGHHGPRVAPALVIAILLLVPAGSVIAADPSAPERWIPGLATSDSISGPTFASGQLVDSAGRSRQGLVLAVAWPTFATLAALSDGDEVKTLAIAQDKAGNDGHFTLRVDPAIQLSEYTEEDGTLNLDIYAQGAEGRSVLATSRRLAAGGGQVGWADPRAPEATPADIALVLGRAGAAVSDGPSTTVPAEDKVFPCPDYVKATYDQRWTAIGETYPGPSATAQFKYVNTATSSLGVGFSASGTYGSSHSPARPRTRRPPPSCGPKRLPTRNGFTRQPSSARSTSNGCCGRILAASNGAMRCGRRPSRAA
jgi:hypothetical protein